MAPKKFVLCFDGTGNKFSGTDSDSNILKIYRMLDKTQGDSYHYYQPGIGTYVTTSDLEHTGIIERFQSWYSKAKDSAVGTSFAQHVMGGYQFLMRYYTSGDDIYFFGFSRGAYTARFLAEMLDHVGLLSAGNEELARFAWKTFSKWQSRRGGSGEKAKREEQELYKYMENFQSTFSRKVRRIRFLGLFDTVNSVPRFETAWMQRSKFPYTARSSAKVIRHAVAINERRAKFRQDLINSTKQLRDQQREVDRARSQVQTDGTTNHGDKQEESGRANINGSALPNINMSTEKFFEAPEEVDDLHIDVLPIQQPVEKLRERRESLMSPVVTKSIEDMRNVGKEHKRGRLLDVHNENHLDKRPLSHQAAEMKRKAEKAKTQDILEVWFAGCHADIGGGWPKEEAKGETWQLSHTPLVWMVHEAEKAGLKFDPESIADLWCCPDKIDEHGAPDEAHKSKYHQGLYESGTTGFIHDCLEFGEGLPFTSVLSWKMMEYLPFRRMDLKEDGSWEPQRWPLPCGETRDMPDDANVHTSVIERIKHDESYRPGNLIIGGGGRGVKKAGKEYGTGEWVVMANKGDKIGEYFVRAPRPGKR